MMNSLLGETYESACAARVANRLHGRVQGGQGDGDTARGSGFAQVWSMMEQSFRTDLLPADAQRLVADNGRPGQELVLGYWHDLLTTPPADLDAMVHDAIRRVGAARVPYLLIAGSEPPPAVLDRLSREAPHARVEVWADTGHFPHLAHRRRFADRLAATAGWTR
jgi:pimeloyl-ACP methyl ester carboxylesterase